MPRTAMVSVRDKQVRAVELARAGHSYDQIAEQLGYANRSSAWRLVRGGLDAAVAKSSEDYLHAELGRLDALQSAFWDQALLGDLTAATVVFRVIGQRCRLLGLDRAPKQEAVPCMVVCPLAAATRDATAEAGND